MFSKLRRLAFAVVGLMGIFVFAYGAHQHSIYVSYPRSQDAKTGRIFPDEESGVTVFVTRAEMTGIELVSVGKVIFVGMVLLFLLSEYVWPIKPGREKR